MADKSSFSSSRPQFCADATLFPVNYGWQPSLVYNQHFGQPPILDSRDLSWMEGVFRKLGSSSWPGYTRASTFSQYGQTLSLRIHREMGGGLSEVCEERNKWRISLDVNHFAPTELTVRTQAGFLEIEGKHEERQDDHGYVSRCFVRKYKLPVGVDAEAIKSILTGDGILIVEAPLPSVPPPADVTIPVQVEKEVAAPEGKQDGPQPEEIAGRDELVSDASDTLVHPDAETAIQQAVTDESLRHSDGQPEDLVISTEGEQEEIIPTGAEDQQDKEQLEVQTEAMQQEVEEGKIEGGPEEVIEGEGDVAEGLQESEDQAQFPQSSEIVTSEQVEKEEEEVQRTEDEHEHLSAGQFQEEIPSPQEVQEQLAVEQLEKIK